MDNGGGDPHHSRAGLIRQSIQYLYDQAGSGWISYIEFANGIETPLKTVLNPTIFSDVGCVKYNGTATNTLAMDFVSMNDSIVANWTDTSGPVQNRCQNSTTYKAPIERSMQYFQNLNPGNVGVSPAVIFFSDGAPTDYTGAGGLVNLIKFIRTYTGFPGKYPPIYTIFSGNAINAGNGVYMQAMADSTGGTYTQVTPGDVTQITLVMNQILESISKSSKPASVSLTVNGVSYSGTTAIQQSGGAQVTFSSSMPLLSGDNSAQLKVEFIDSVGVSQTHTSSFTLQVNATAEDTGAFPIDTIFSGVCAVANTITVNGFINPLLATSKTLAQIPHLLTDS
jgi:hypothetical protein